MGVIGEKVTKIVDLDAAQFTDGGFYAHRLPYLDGIYNYDKQLIQRLNNQELFKFLRAELFKASKAP